MAIYYYLFVVKVVTEEEGKLNNEESIFSIAEAGLGIDGNLGVYNVC